MALVKAYDEIENPRVERILPSGYRGWRSDFIKRPDPADKTTDTPMAFLAEGSAHRLLRTHFHEVDQFQIIFNGDGTLGKHPIAPGGVHFSRAYTPYGPIKYGDQGLGFITLRAHRDPGAQYLPDSREVLDQIDAEKKRAPWQTTKMADFNIQLGDKGIAMKPIPEIKDDRGLAGYSLVMKPNARAHAPDPSQGDGQYIVVMKGGLVHEGKLRKGLTVVWVAKNESAFELLAGPEGLEAIVLNFPVPGVSPIPGRSDLHAAADYKTWQCVLCSFVYDEALGMPDEGIAPGTRWADVPESFGCPDCSATKADFEMIEL